MVVRWLIAPLSLFALLIPGCGGSDAESTQSNAAQAIAGDWTGALKQKGLAPFRVAVRIEPSGDGRVAYTGIECGGTWSLGVVRYTRPEQYEFGERIDEGAGGKCKGSGSVSVRPELDSKAFDSRLQYEFRGGGVTSRGLLNRTDAAGLKPVFDEARVTPP